MVQAVILNTTRIRQHSGERWQERHSKGKFKLCSLACWASRGVRESSSVEGNSKSKEKLRRCTYKPCFHDSGLLIHKESLHTETNKKHIGKWI